MHKIKEYKIGRPEATNLRFLSHSKEDQLMHILQSEVIPTNKHGRSVAHFETS